MPTQRKQPMEEMALDCLSTMHTDGLLSRRELMRRASMFGAVATLGTFGSLRRVAAQGRGAGKVTVGLDSGAFTPILKTFALEFKAATGIEVDFQSYPLANMYDQNLLALRQRQARFDAFDYWPNFVGDFGPFLTPLQDVGTLEALNFSDVAPPFQRLNIYENKIVGIMIDGDMFINTVRTDLFEHSDEMRAFKTRYGYDLAAPKNYQEYKDTAEFFTRPEQNLYGLVEITSYFTYAFFINHLVQLQGEKGARFGELFDADMRPLLVNEDCEEALKRSIEMTRFMPANLAKAMPWDIGRQEFFAGRAAQANWFTDMPKGAADATISKVAGKIRCAQSWGPVTLLPYGRAMGISANSRNKDGAFKAIAWLQQSKQANAWVAETFEQSLMDPWRMSMFDDPQSTFPLHAQSGFADNFAAVCKDLLSNPRCYLDISIPGTNRYLGTMVQHLQRATTGETTPRQALQDMATEFEDTTNVYGRDRQAQHYEEYRKRMITGGYWTA